jgi:hypothetical protein
MSNTPTGAGQHDAGRLAEIRRPRQARGGMDAVAAFR